MISKLRIFFSRLDFGLIIVAMIPIIGILPTLTGGLANGSDASFHAHRIDAMARLIQNGDLYPRWVSYFHMGYGYPVFNYYAPGATHFGAFFQLLGFHTIAAYNLVNIIMWSIGSIGTYLLARTFLSVRAAIFAAVLWAYAPSRFFEFWWQGSLAQIVASSFIPLVFYGIIRTVRSPSLRTSLSLALPFAAIILSHTPTTYITALIVAPFCLVVPLPLRNPRVILLRWLYIGIGLALAAGLSAIFLLPVLAEVQYVRIAGDLPSTISYLTSKFLTLGEVFSYPQIIDSTDLTLTMPRALGLIGGGLSVVGAFTLVLRKRYLLAILLLVGIGFILFMTLEASLDIWLAFPSLRNLRFPERFLRMGAVFIALLGASSILLIPRRWQGYAMILLSVFVILQALPLMRPRDDHRFWITLSAITEIEMEFTEHNWGTTAYDEYEPIWGKITPYDMPPEVEEYADDPFQIRIKESDLIRDIGNLRYEPLDDNRVRVMLEEAQSIRFRQFYFPGWQVTIDDNNTPIRADGRFGLIEVDVPAGEHIITLNYVGTNVQRIANVITLITIGISLWIFLRTTPSTVSNDNEVQSLSSREAWMILIGLVVVAGINGIWLQSSVFRLSSPARQPQYMATQVNALFEDSIELLGYTIESDQINLNTPLGIRLYWHSNNPPAVAYRPIVQLVNLNVSAAWAVSEPLHFEGGKSTALSANHFMSDYHQLKLFDQTPPYVGRISIQLASLDDNSFATLPDGGTRLILDPIIQINTSPLHRYEGSDLGIKYGDDIVLKCADVTGSPEHFDINLWWQVNQTSSIDYKVFIHGIDPQGNVIQQTDAFPLEGLYPTSYWQSGQVLLDAYTLPFDEEIASISIGLYDPVNGRRVRVQNGSIESDRLEIPAKPTSCQS